MAAGPRMTGKVFGANGSASWPLLGKGGAPDNAQQRAKELKELKEKLELEELRAKLKKFGKGDGRSPGGNTASRSWDCACGFHNFGFRNQCKDCGAQKPRQDQPNRNPKGGGKGGLNNTGSPNPKGAREAVATGGEGNPETEEEKKSNIAKGMLAAARALPECPEQKKLVKLWEGELEDIKERERRNRPVPLQLKSVLDRVATRKKGVETAIQEVSDLREKLGKAEEQEAEAQRMLELETAELERIQDEMAKQHVGAAGGGQPVNPKVEEVPVHLMAVQINQCLTLLGECLAFMPENVAMKGKVQQFVQATAAATARIPSGIPLGTLPEGTGAKKGPGENPVGEIGGSTSAASSSGSGGGGELSKRSPPETSGETEDDPSKPKRPKRDVLASTGLEDVESDREE